jgi:hypothetical protein
MKANYTNYQHVLKDVYYTILRNCGVLLTPTFPYQQFV